MWIESVVFSYTWTYDSTSTFAQTSAATTPASSTAALPVSVRRNHAHREIHPAATGHQALLTAGDALRQLGELDLVEVRARCGGHVSSSPKSDTRRGSVMRTRL
jgi:hypothetical protein